VARESSRRAGEVTTFYSYKGGTGRTFVLANVAFLLASQGKRVCVIDWDLEAPGLHRFFRPFLEDPELEITEGLIEWLWDVTADQLSRDESSASQANVEYYVVPLSSPQWEFPRSGCVDFLPAGRQDSEYAKRVTSFDWTAFYDRLGGADVIDGLRDYLKNHYDHVLIDSRTGVSDTSGICTIDMPDQLVACYTLNRQSIYGVERILHTIGERRGNRKLRIFPLETRVDPSEFEKLAAAIEVARPLFRNYANEHKDQTGYWEDMGVRYIPFYAFEECVALFAEDPKVQSAASLLRPMCRITSRVFLGGMPLDLSDLPEIPREARDAIMDQYSLGVDRSQLAATQDSELERVHAEAEMRYNIWAGNAEKPGTGEGRLLDREELEELDDAGPLPASLAANEGFTRYVLASRDALKRRHRVFSVAWVSTIATIIVVTVPLALTLPADAIVIIGSAIGGLVASALAFLAERGPALRRAAQRRSR
jgi:hypothetical protein